MVGGVLGWFDEDGGGEDSMREGNRVEGNRAEGRWMGEDGERKGKERSSEGGQE